MVFLKLRRCSASPTSDSTEWRPWGRDLEPRKRYPSWPNRFNVDHHSTLLPSSLMQPFNQVDADAPLTIAFQAVRMNWAKYIVAFGALKGMTTILLANIIAQARYFTHCTYPHAVINEKTRTPMNATIIMTIANSIVAFFTSLDMLSDLLSVSTLFIFSLVAVALIVR
jgi:amino acid transporter